MCIGTIRTRTIFTELQHLTPREIKIFITVNPETPGKHPPTPYWSRREKTPLPRLFAAD